MDIASLSLGGAALTGPLDSGRTCGGSAGQVCDPEATAVRWKPWRRGMTVMVVAAGNSGRMGSLSTSALNTIRAAWPTRRTANRGRGNDQLAQLGKCGDRQRAGHKFPWQFGTGPAPICNDYGTRWAILQTRAIRSVAPRRPPGRFSGLISAGRARHVYLPPKDPEPGNGRGGGSDYVQQSRRRYPAGDERSQWHGDPRHFYRL